MQANILNGVEAKKWLMTNIDQNAITIDFCSAYIKLATVDYFISLFRENGFTGSIRLLSRWKASDLCSESSDLEVYEYCQSSEIDFYIKQDFHGKIYQAYPAGLLIGSFNLTNSGFALRNLPNDEVGISLPCTTEYSDFIDRLFKSSKLVDDRLYQKMKEFIAQSKNETLVDIDWPESIRELLQNNESVNKYLVNEFFYKDCESMLFADGDLDLLHDLSLLGLSINDLVDTSKVANRLRNSTPYIWLKHQLSKADGELYFGSLTQKLHDCLVDDPKPYRKDVKNLSQNLFSWVSRFDGAMVIDRPNHSQRIRLLT